MTFSREALLAGVAVLASLVLQACATTPGAPAPTTAVAVSTPPCEDARACLAACSRGEVRACTLAADGLRYGTAVPRDLPRAERLYRQACQANDGLGCAGLGWVLQGREAEQASARALPLLEAACAREDAEACVAAGTLLHAGRGGTRPTGATAEALLARGVTLLSAACEAGRGEACVRAATLLDSGPAPVRAAPRARVLFQKGCDAGVPGGCTALGLRSLSGQGVERNRARARELLLRGGELFRAACEAGRAAACLELARASARGEGMQGEGMQGEGMQGEGMQGEGLRPDPVRALGYEERACTLGEAEACASGAARLRKGEGVPQDAAKAQALEARAKLLREEGCRDGSSADCLALAGDAPPEEQRALRARACALGRTEACTAH